MQLAGGVDEHALWGGHLRFILDGPHGPGTFATTVGWVGGVLNDAVSAAARDGAVLIDELQGRRFAPDESGLLSLFGMAAG